MKKIAFVGTDALLSGATLSMIALAKHLQETKEYNVIVIIPGHGEIEEYLKNNGLKYYVVKSYSWIISNYRKINEKMLINFKYYIKTFLNTFAIKKIEKILLAEKVDLIHINSLYSYVAAKAAIKNNIKVIWHIREFLEEDQNAKFFNKEKALKLIEKSTAIITISKSVYNKYSKLINNNNIYMIYNGIDVSKYYNENKEIFKKDSIIELVLAGTIQDGKGQKELLKALSLLKNETKRKFHLTLLGYANTKAKNELNQLINSLGLENNVDYIGFNKNVKDFFDKADISFNCSKSEAYGRTTVEAMLSGLLVIGSNTAGTAELIEDMKTGLLYEYGNEEDLKEKIKFAIQNKNISRKIACTGQEYAKNEYTSIKNMESIRKVYDKIFYNEKLII